MFAEVCFISYLSSLKHAFRFKFAEELTTVDGFGLAILEHAAVALRSLECNGLSNPTSYNNWGPPQVAHHHKSWTILDPFTKEKFQY